MKDISDLIHFRTDWIRGKGTSTEHFFLLWFVEWHLSGRSYWIPANDPQPRGQHPPGDTDSQVHTNACKQIHSHPAWIAQVIKLIYLAVTLNTWDTFWFKNNRIRLYELLHQSKSLLLRLSCGCRGLDWARCGRCPRGQRSGGAAERQSCVRKVCGAGVFTGPGLAPRGVTLAYPSADTGNSQQHQAHPRIRCGRQRKRRRWTTTAMSWLGHLLLQREVNYQHPDWSMLTSDIICSPACCVAFWK